MAFLLYRYIRRKIRDHQVKKDSSTIEDSNLMPEIAPSQSGNGMLQRTQHESNIGSHQDKRSGLSSAEEAAREKEETRKRTIRQWKLMLGLALPNFLASVDVTIVAPAIPLISSHFSRSIIIQIMPSHILTHRADQLSGSFNWIVAAYTLTFTTFVPASGQLADIYGRHFALQFEMFWIMIGSVLCAAAQSWGMLLLGRALQGLGAAGILSVSRIILSDGATLAENARNNSILSLVGGIG
jgi:hypothetical protein